MASAENRASGNSATERVAEEMITEGMPSGQRSSRAGALATWSAIAAVSLGGGLGLSSKANAQSQLPGNNNVSIQVDPEQVKGVQELEDGTDVVSRWNSNNNLYIDDVRAIRSMNMGDQRALERLAETLAKQYPHWTVVLCGKAADESYRSAASGRRSGYQAMDWAIKDLVMKGEFQDTFRDDRSGLSAGSVMYISFDSDGRNRKVGVSTSPLLEHYGLSDESTWEGNYDQSVINQLRNRNLEAAVVAGIQQYESRLNTAIQREIADAQRTIDNANRAASGSAAAFTQLQSQLTQFNRDYPGRTGDIAKPNLDDIQTNVQLSASALEREDYRLAKSAGDEARRDIDAIAQQLSTYGQAEDTFARLSGDAGALSETEYGAAARTQLQANEALIATALASWERGESQYIAQLSEAERDSARLSKLLNDTLPQAAAALGTLRGELEEQSDRKRSGSADDEFEAAETAIAAVENALAVADPNSAELIGAAQNAVADVVESIDGADRAAMIRNATLALLALGIGGLALGMNRRAAGRKQEALELLEKQKKLVGETGTISFDINEMKDDVLGVDSQDVVYSGKTKELAEASIEKADSLFANQLAANAIIEKAEKLIASASPSNLFLTSNFDQAIEILQNERVSFKDNPAVQRALEAGKESGDKDRWERLKRLQEKSDKTYTFEGLLEEFETVGKEAEAGFAEIQESIEKAEKWVDSVNGEYDAMLARFAEYEESVAERPTLSLQGLQDSQAYQDIDDRIAATSKKVMLDPVLAAEEGDSISTEIAKMNAIVAEAENVFASRIPTMRQRRDVLTDNDLSDAWVATEMTAAYKTLNSGDLDSYRTKFQRVEGRVTDAVNIVESANSLKDDQIETAAFIEASKQNLAEQLGLEPKDIFTEENLDPVEILERSEQDRRDTMLLVSKGALKEASVELSTAKNDRGRAHQIAVRSNEIAEELTEQNRQLEASVESLYDNDLVEVQAILESISDSFDSDVLDLTAGDPSHPGGNGTISDNIQETEDAREEALSRIARSRELFEQGRFIEADALYDSALANHEFMEHRITEIRDKEQRLNDTVQRNARKLDTARRELAVLDEDGQDPRIMQGSLQTLRQLSEHFGTVEDLHTTEKPNPFQVERHVTNLLESIDGLKAQYEADHAAYEEAYRSTKAAAKAIADAKRYYRGVEGDSDGIGDSAEMTKAYGRIRSLESKLVAFERATDPDNIEAHADWDHIDDEVDEIFAAVGAAHRAIKGEVAEGTDAQRDIEAARRKVRAARTWSGSYGVSIYGNPGRNELERARQFLAAGQYDQAERAAGRAKSKAASAISSAESEVAAKRRAEQRRIEAERARRRREEAARRRRASSSSSSSFGSFSSGSSSSSFGGFSSGSSSSSW